MLTELPSQPHKIQTCPPATLIGSMHSNSRKKSLVRQMQMTRGVSRPLFLMSWRESTRKMKTRSQNRSSSSWGRNEGLGGLSLVGRGLLSLLACRWWRRRWMSGIRAIMRFAMFLFPGGRWTMCANWCWMRRANLRYLTMARRIWAALRGEIAVGDTLLL